MIFWAIIFWVAAYLVTELIRPKPNFEDARPAGQGDFQFPTATEGRSVPLVWGKVPMKGPNVVWYGNVRQRPITEKVKTGLFSSEEVTKGYRYYVGMQFGLCLGPGVVLHQIKVNDKILASGTWAVDTIFGVNSPGILGGDEFGSGGISGNIAFYTGSDTQAVNAYLSTRQVPNVAYRGTAHLVFQGGYIGNSPNIQPWSFIVSRIPDGLNLAVADPGAEEPTTGTCNPMNVLYEIMTDQRWGLKIPSAEIDVPNFVAAASQLFAEGNGFAMLLDREIEATDMLNEVIRQCDGTLFFDRGLGQWQMVLARGGYDPGTLPEYDESVITELTEYTRQTWDETTNQVRVRFSDSSDDFKVTYGLAQDPGNALIQGRTVASEVNYPGVKDKTLANSIAWREQRVLGYPLSKISFKMNRQGFNLRPGSLFKWSWARLGVSGIVYRVGRIDPGTLVDGKIKVFAVEDIFSTGVGVFGDPTGTGWQEPDDNAVALLEVDTLTFEAPRQMVIQDPVDPALQPRVWAGGRDPGGGTINFAMWLRTGPGPGRPTGSFIEDARVNTFLAAGTLASAIPQYAANANRPDNVLQINVTDNSPDSLTDLVTAGDSSSVRTLVNLIYVGGEFIGFETMIDLTGTVRLTQIWRGLFNSVQTAHAISDRVWFIGQTGGNMTLASLLAAHDEMDLKVLSQDVNGPVSEASTTTQELSLSRIWQQPLPVRDPVINSTYADTTNVSLDVQYIAGTGRTGDDARAVQVECTPRAWRVDDITQDQNTALSAPSYLGDSPVLDYDLTLDPGGTPIAVPTVSLSDEETPVAYLLRNDIIVAVGANANIPSTAELLITPKHTTPEVGSQLSGQVLTHAFTITTGISGDALTFGGLIQNTASTAVIFNETGTYNFDIHTALPSSGILEANVNGGGFATVVAAGNTTGTLAITATDSVVLRFSQAPAGDQYFDITGPVSETGHGVLQA